MKFRAFLSALLLAAGIVCVAAGAETKQVSSPTQVLKEFFAAMREADFAKIALLSEGEPRQEALQMIAHVKQLEQESRTGDEKAKALALEKLAFVQQSLKDFKSGLKNVKIEIRNEKIEGDLAVVEAAVTGADGKIVVEESYFKKVGDQWKVIHQNDYKAEKKKQSAKK